MDFIAKWLIFGPLFYVCLRLVNRWRPRPANSEPGFNWYLTDSGLKWFLGWIWLAAGLEVVFSVLLVFVFLYFIANPPQQSFFIFFMWNLSEAVSVPVNLAILVSVILLLNAARQARTRNWLIWFVILAFIGLYVASGALLNFYTHNVSIPL
jgi:hypothetical protein